MKCPNCNGTLVFDVKDQNLKCLHCDSFFDVDKFTRDFSAEEYAYEGMKLYTCKNCGAELLGMDSEAVTYCSYCGSEAILQSELSNSNKPRNATFQQA